MLRRWFALLFVLALALSILGLGANLASAQGGEYKLTVLHTGENHGHWESFTATISVGGIARRATAAQKARAEGGNVVMVDTGDISQGSLYHVQHRMVEARDLYNAVGYEVVTFGNHEFNFGPKTLADNFVTGAKFGIVNTNLDFSAEPALAGKIPTTLVKTIGGEKVGFIGLVIDGVGTVSSPGPNIKVKDAVDSAKAAIADLEKQGVNKIILLSHRGYNDDLRLAAQLDGVDVVVGGHTNTLLGDAAKLDKSLGAPEGPYPAVVKAPNGNPVLVAHASEWGKLLGRINVTFDAKGVPTDHTINVREVRLSAGAEFVVAICGEIMTMPGLPRVPAADAIDVGPDGRIVGLF